MVFQLQLQLTAITLLTATSQMFVARTVSRSPHPPARMKEGDLNLRSSVPRPNFVIHFGASFFPDKRGIRRLYGSILVKD